MSKRALIINAFQATRSSYWFLPTVLALTAVAGSQLSLYLDHNRSSLLYVWPDSWETTQVDGARATLSVIAQSVLGVVGVMFSVTIVAVSFASGNFGPRLIGNFMRDRGTQWSLGILISTFVFALLILRSVHSADGAAGSEVEAFVPHLSLGIAITLVALSIMAVIYYVHHIPETINVSNISAGLGARLRTAIQATIDDQDEEQEDAFVPPDRDPDVSLCLGSNGYIQTHDESRLRELANDHDVSVRVSQSVGAFVNTYSPVIDVWGTVKIDDDVREKLCGCFVVGATPTEDQNMLFIVQQLVEMIARALSPGVNDPYTAINCLNWLYAALATASNYDGGLKDIQTGRVWKKRVLFADIFESGIVRSYSYIKTDALTHTHLMQMLERLVDEIGPGKDADLVLEFIDGELDASD